MLQTLSMAGVPWYFDERTRAYRIRPGFKFPLAENAVAKVVTTDEEAGIHLLPLTDQLIEDGEAFAESLQQFLDALKSIAKQKSDEPTE